MNHCHDYWGCVIHGTKGSAELGEGISKPRLFKSHLQTPEHVTWQWKGAHPQRLPGGMGPPHGRHPRTTGRHNETERCANAAMVGILGRMAIESVNKSFLGRSPRFRRPNSPPDSTAIHSIDGPAPVQPDASGRYPIPAPGQPGIV
jgi:hypothetical protein